MHFGLAIVPQQTAYVIERFGKFHSTLEPGLHFLVPFVDRIAYTHSLKEEAISVSSQQAITRDNVSITIDGVLYAKIDDPYHASYGVENVRFALMQLAQTTMRSELGKITLDKTFEEREQLNDNIVAAINGAASAWGIRCLRYEIRDIAPPPAVRAAMDLQAEAERRKRAEILRSEGDRDSVANAAEGVRKSTVLRAQGEAEAIIARAKANAEGIRVLAESIGAKGGSDAVSLRVAEQYMSAFAKLAKTGNTLLLPANTGDVGSMVAQAMSVYNTVQSSSKASRKRAAQSAAAGTALEDADLGEGVGLEAFDSDEQDADEEEHTENRGAAVAGKAFVPKPFRA